MDNNAHPLSDSTPGRIFLIAAWFALASGLLEASIFLFIQLVPGWITWEMRLVNVTSEILWIAPLFNLSLFIVLASFLLIATTYGKKLLSLTGITPEITAVFLFASMSFYAVVRVTHRIYPWAIWLLALGLGIQVSRWFRDRQQGGITLFRRSLIPLLLVVALSAGATTGLRAFPEAALTRTLPVPPPAASNVLLIVLDALRADHLSSYGYSRPTTPNMDKFARQGVLFERAYATSSWSVASHASILTGRFPYEHGADGLEPVMGNQYPTLAEVMASQGYATAGFSANTWWVTRNSGFDRGFSHFEDYFSSLSDMVARTVYGKEIAYKLLPRLGYRDNLGRKTAVHLRQAVLDWLDAHPGRPFFVFMNYMDVHDPYLSPYPYHTQFMNDHERARERRFSFRPLKISDHSPKTASLLKAAYDGALAFLDSELAMLFDELQRRGLLDSTLVILTSDHGESFGEHGLLHHGHSLYLDQLHVPLVMRLPTKIPAGLRVSEPVSLRDIPLTVTSTLSPNTSPAFPGQSLALSWSDTASRGRLNHAPILSEVASRDGVPKDWPISRGSHKSLITSQWHFILHEDGNVELYNLQTDWTESQNLATTPNGRKVVGDFRNVLANTLAKRGPAR